MRTKFNIGEEVFFMKFGSEASKNTVKGIAVIVGDFEDSSFKRNGTLENPCITYCMSCYVTVNENKVFRTKEELIEDVFKNL